MKAMCPPGYHDNGFMETLISHALGHMMYSLSSCVQEHELLQRNCGNNLEGTLFS